MQTHVVSSDPLNIELIDKIISQGYQLKLSENSVRKIENCRNYLDRKLAENDAPVYGINTGFGSLCKIKISGDDIEKLQYNLIVSHACGTGDIIPDDVCKILLLLKIQSLSYGYSGVSSDTVLRLIDFFNHNMLPVIYEQGSLGASGDLCPLAHLSLPLIGLGKIKINNEIRNTDEVIKAFHPERLKLKSKEGLALLNGTQFMGAYAVKCLILAEKILAWGDLIAALSLEAWNCKSEPFNIKIHKIRNQSGQVETCRNILNLLQGSETFFSEKEQVQDAYSFRCIPQVHGASRDAIKHCKEIVTKEINGVTDNPNVFADDDLILSGGNFHGHPLSITLDFLAIALSGLGNISERRTYKMLSGGRGLPEFLTPNAGLNSGLMIPQYVAASMVSQNKQLCTPASVDSISSCNEQEDYVSMGANAATKCLRVAQNIERILAIELLTAAQAFDFRKPAKSSEIIEGLHAKYRNTISFNEYDRYLHEDIMKSVEFIQSRYEY